MQGWYIATQIDAHFAGQNVNMPQEVALMR